MAHTYYTGTVVNTEPGSLRVRFDGKDTRPPILGYARNIVHLLYPDAASADVGRRVRFKSMAGEGPRFATFDAFIEESNG
jgi:hypothetical protein